jgi:hypothetical protein
MPDDKAEHDDEAERHGNDPQQRAPEVIARGRRRRDPPVRAAESTKQHERDQHTPNRRFAFQ